MALSFDGKSGKTREIKDDNFSHFMKKIVLSFDRKPEKLVKFVKLEMITLISREKMSFCHLRENPEMRG